MKRIFIPEIKLGEYILDKENENYLKNVLRFKENDEFLAFDGQKEALATYHGKYIAIKEITRTAVNINGQYLEPSSKLAILKLAIGQIKQPALEWLVEKATEIGVNEIFLLETKFTQNKNCNIKRLEKIAIAACKQSNRITIPKIYAPKKLDQFIKEHENETWAFGNLSKNESSKNQPNITNKNNIHEKSNGTIIGIVIGPEGGFEENESEKLFQHFIPLCLSQNILRAETAALVGLIYILELYYPQNHIYNN